MSRTVSNEGRSKAIAGGSGVPAGLLSELAGDLVVIHGQSDQQQLLHPSRQRECLDLFGGSKLLAARAAFRTTYERVRDLTAELEQVTSHRRERAQQADLLRFGLGEIDAVEPIAGEDVELLAEESRLAHADGLRVAADSARQSVSGDGSAINSADALSLVALARKSLEAERDHDPAIGRAGGSIGDSLIRAGRLRCRSRQLCQCARD